MRKIISFLIIFVFCFIYTSNFNNLKAFNNTCGGRYVTLINPVRGRELWIDKTNNPIINQYNVAKESNLPVTWLLQYDTFADDSLVSEIKKFDSKQELGLFLEVSETLAKNARIAYPINRPWAGPDVIFLSGYERKERTKLIDTLFKDFKKVYGYYPKSVGAWWIDSYSIEYMKNKYGIVASMIVADQKITDHYGVWGQWWGVPYFPKKENILLPATTQNNADVVVMQWAQRHPDLALGDGHLYSNFSFQANDYIRQGLNTNFFKSLVDIYFDCRNSFAQITIGLETGMEGVGYLNEYKNQIKYLTSYPNISFVTMSDLYSIYKPIYKKLDSYRIYGEKTNWVMTKDYRQNEGLGEKIDYNNFSSFKDYFVEDNDSFLNRRLEAQNKIDNNSLFFSIFLILWIFIVVILYKRNKIPLLITATLFLTLAFGLLLRSSKIYGHFVYFGPVVNNLMYVQAVVVLVTFLIFSIPAIKKISHFIILSFGFDYLISLPRYTQIEDTKYFGVLVDAFRFVGLSINSNYNIKFVNSDFSSFVADSMLKFDFNKIWENNLSSLFIYPLVHIIFGYILYLLIPRFNRKIRHLIMLLLAIFTFLFLYTVLNSDPVAVV